MKGLKALKQLPIKSKIKVLVERDNRITEYYRSEKYIAYTADVVQSTAGEILVVCVYQNEDTSKRKHKAELQIMERHFISSSGDIAAEQYSSNLTARSGQFTVTTSRVGGWEVSSAAIGMKYERHAQFFIPYENADETIFDFAERHHLYEFVKRTYSEYTKPRTYSSGLCWLAAYQMKYKDKKANEAKERLRLRTLSRMEQVGDTHMEEFENWLAQETLTEAPWFYKFKKRIAEGVCGACGKVSTIPGVKNNKKGTCPHCGRPIQYLTVKNADKCVVEQFRASFIEVLPSANEFVTRYFTVSKWYRNDGLKAKFEVSTYETHREFWGVKNENVAHNGLYSGMRSYYVNDNKRWERIPINSYVNQGMIFSGNVLDITKSLAHMLGSKRLENMDLRPLFENNRELTPSAIFCKVLAMPAMESMGKMGLFDLAFDWAVQADLEAALGSQVAEIGSPAKLLGVDKIVLARFAKMNITGFKYRLWYNWGLTANDLDTFEKFVADYSDSLSEISSLFRVHGLVKLGTAARYLDKQRSKFGLSAEDAVMYWKDYLDMCRATGQDLERHKELFFPVNLKKEHDRYAEMKANIENAAYIEGLAEREDLLVDLTFADNDFIIAPLSNVRDFVNESNELHHCVKTYMKRCSKGETNIFVLRKADEPEKPYFTVNISNDGHLIQNRGLRNCPPPKEVQNFVKRWLTFVKKKLKTLSLEPSHKNIQIKIGA